VDGFVVSICVKKASSVVGFFFIYFIFFIFFYDRSKRHTPSPPPPIPPPHSFVSAIAVLCPLFCRVVVVVYVAGSRRV
jgi:hypothetical protein